MIDQEVINEVANDFEERYMNKMQLRATIIDANVIIAKVARATGKTEGIFGPRMIRISQDLPGQTSVIINKTYVSLLSNIVPNIVSYFNKPVGTDQKPLLEEGIDYILGSTKLPSHFKKPLRPPAYPKHSWIMANGHTFQLAASDQPESVAGQSFVHAFIEEMKHNKGEKLKTRLFPSIRGATGSARRSAYFEGITGVSDAARVDLGEDNWFEDYENVVNQELIDEIWTVGIHVNDVMVKMEFIYLLIFSHGLKGFGCFIGIFATKSYLCFQGLHYFKLGFNLTFFIRLANDGKLVFKKCYKFLCIIFWDVQLYDAF